MGHLAAAVQRAGANLAKLNDPRLAALDPLLQSSELRQLMVEVRPSFELARFDKTLADDRQYLGEKYLPVFLADVIKILG